MTRGGVNTIIAIAVGVALGLLLYRFILVPALGG